MTRLQRIARVAFGGLCCAAGLSTVFVASLGLAGAFACVASSVGVLTAYRALTAPLVYAPPPRGEPNADRQAAA